MNSKLPDLHICSNLTVVDESAMQDSQITSSCSQLMTQGSAPSAILLAWAAGFLDGEGCIHIAKQRYQGTRSDSYRLGVHVSQNDRSTLDSFCDAVGIRAPIYATKRAANHSRQCYTLNYSGQSALKLLIALMPYLNRKLREAKAALQFSVEGGMGVRRSGKTVDPALAATREHYYRLLKQLK